MMMCWRGRPSIVFSNVNPSASISVRDVGDAHPVSVGNRDARILLAVLHQHQPAVRFQRAA